jgi:RNA polymerase sigma-70 factor (sigma-E family)
VSAEAEGFSQFVVARERALQRTAVLLTGDWALAEDLVQTALAKTWPRWERISGRDDPELYVRRVMVNTWATWWRRRWRGERASAAVPEGPAPGDVAADVAVRDALGSLTRRQRAVLVLRVADDLSEAQVAQMLGCPPGTVKNAGSVVCLPLAEPVAASGAELAGPASSGQDRAAAGSEDLAEAEYVPDAGLHLEAAGQPGTPDTGGVGCDRDQVVALGGKPDLGWFLGPVRFPDRCPAAGPDPGHEGHSEIGDLAADHAVHHVGLAVRLVHLGDPAGQVFQRLTAFLGGRHETPHFPLPPL